MATRAKNISPSVMANSQPRRLMTVKNVLLIGSAIAFLAGLGVWKIAHQQNLPTMPLSRQVMDYQQSIVRTVKPPPTTAALQYAYVTSAYADGLKSGSQRTALQAAQAMLDMLYPDRQAAINAQMLKLAATNNLKQFGAIDPLVTTITSAYASRYVRDGHVLVWDGVVPKGPGKWYRTSAKDPFTPRAGEWLRWNMETAISVPPPPALNSQEDLRQISIVTAASASRNGQAINIINFWGGTPGSETPAGIWQNQLYKTVTAELPRTRLAADSEYALVQKDLAQTLSDAFMECWKVKYTYWTARPSMRIPGLQTAMNDPNFPGYISGHSTISKAAADVLSVEAPSHREAWQAMAMEARQSRLQAGIHFDIDNVVGFTVGDEVARQTTDRLNLHRILN